MDKPEVLAHVSTPATRANDDLYRSLADAYLAFEPHRPSEKAEDKESLPGHVSFQSNRPQPSQGLPLGSAPAVSVLNSMDSYGSFPSHLHSGDRSSDQTHSDNHETPSSAEGVSISRLERLERMQSRWKEQRTPRSSLAKDRRQSISTVIAPAEESTFIEDTQQAILAMESQLPDDMSTTSEEASDDDADEFVDQDVTLGATEVARPDIDRTPFGPSSGNLQTKPQRDASPDEEQSATQKSHKTDAPERTVQAPSSQCSIVPVDVESKETSQTRQPETQGHRVDFDCLASTVCPPPPKITILTPSTLPSQITPYLDKLKQENPGRFKTKVVLRALEADERGHWRVDCRLWPKHVQHQFWTFLQKDVESGRLGWGVTLHRDPMKMRLGLVRFYCWGETVEHVWLALWLHSGGRVWSTGATWLDGGDIEVLSIP
ncbi:hypothetical protein DPSP01_007135 [Paraphaeosphaeria sporulosa]|uniref:Uncharacterized protein n=1 Tax=Paraphaeosphaeria sporulosa TaxID=1460663 RepID=A0A177CNI5_9PLEO|nr:uncharacterized protein CC84DRAFT_1204045 [Paraphaeosphaeria sporulosa]OAG08771.1 hypothetical protein CC84DRAFT_1204045 [Paraphaeosphaeria sporulosa]